MSAVPAPRYPLRALRHWLDASITNRITAAALAVAVICLCITGTASYSFTYHQLKEQIQHELDSEATLAIQHLEMRLNPISEGLAQLAANTLSGNALTDSADRDSYLLPFLHDFQTSGLAPQRICLLDLRSIPLACAGSEEHTQHEDTAWHEQILGGNQPAARLSGGPDGELLLAYPVLQPGTGQPGGMLVVHFGLEQLLGESADAIGERTLRFFSAGELLYTCKRCSQTSPLLKVNKPLRLSFPLDTLNISVEVGEIRETVFLPLRRLSLIYLGLGILILIFVIMVARAISHRITLPLTTLTRSADHIAQSGEYELALHGIGNDELGRLANSFRLMLERLQTSHDLLEHRVERRTEALHQKEAALRAQRNDYQVIFDAVPAFIMYFDRDGCVLRANRRVADYLARPMADLLGKTAFELFPRPFAERCLATNSEVIQDGRERFNIIDVLPQPDGELVWLRMDKAPFRGSDGEILGVVVFTSNITQEIHAQEHMRLTAKVFDNTLEGIFIVDAHRHIVAVNRAFCKITGYLQEEILGKDPSILASGKQGANFYREFWKTLLEQGEWRGELWNRRKNGEIYAEHLSVSVVRNDEEEITHYVGVFSDITTLKKAEQRLEMMAYYDALTNLPNRTLFTERLRHSLTQRQREPGQLGVMFIDLDRFKLINDTLGHEAGDQLLKHVAGQLQKCLREQDTVARLGGDEFIALLERPGDEQQVVRIAERMLKALAQPFMFGNQEVFTGASIGIAMYPTDGEDMESLMKNADTAMYRAKNSGRNTYVFYQAEMNANSHQRLLLESELRRALQQAELTLYFQPQIDLASGRVIGAETLVRWNHPEHGLLLPAAFLPGAEESGTILDIDRWVLRHACHQYRNWQDEGLKGLQLAVNLSSRHILKRQLPAELRQLFTDLTLSGGWLELEFTETSLIQHNTEVQEALHEIKQMGVRIAIDDFGTGYSSLLYLKRFPIDVLKIDQSFVSGVPKNTEDTSIIEAILAMAARLNLRVVAEGVELSDQASYLHDNGCPEAQGYFYGRPMPAEEFGRLYAAQQRGHGALH